MIFVLMKVFYTPEIKDAKSYILPEDESKHAIKVLRLTIGDKITLVDGKGFFYHTEISNIVGKKCEVSILQKEAQEQSPNQLHIAIAPTKNNDRMEWFIEKVTEIGIAEITPLICDNSERKVIKTERLEKRAISAMKQSLKAHLPKINDAISFKEFINSTDTENAFIAHCYNGNEKHLKDSFKANNDCTVLIGPEGDFSEAEVGLALNNNIKAVSLGKSRLRTETAGLYACSIFNLMNEA